jgi:hypothetical protein
MLLLMLVFYSDVWRRIFLHVARHNYLDLLALGSVCRNLFLGCRDGFVWYMAYRALFSCLPRRYIDMQPSEWQHFFLQQVKLRLRWHKHGRMGLDPWETTLSKRIHPWLSPSAILVHACGLIRSDLPIAFYHVLEAENMFGRDSPCVVMDATCVEMERSMVVPAVADKERVVIGFDQVTQLLVCVVHSGDHCMESLCFMDYRSSTAKPVLTISLADIASKFGQVVVGMRFTRLALFQDKFYLVGIEHPSKRVCCIRFALNVKDPLPVFEAFMWFGEDKAASVFIVDDHPGWIVTVPTDTMQHPQLWSLDHAKEPAVILEGLQVYEKHQLNFHSEVLGDASEQPIRLIVHSDRTTVWNVEICHLYKNKGTLGVKPSITFSHAVQNAHTLVTSYAGLLFQLTVDGQLVIVDVSGAGQIVWNAVHGKWQILRNHMFCAAGAYTAMSSWRIETFAHPTASNTRPHVLATLTYPEQRMFETSDTQYMYMTCTNAAYRLRLDGTFS